MEHTQWEYLEWDVKDDDTATLNRLGSLGWELVSTNTRYSGATVAYFKRPV